MLSVVVPVLNEERTIGKVVRFAKQAQSVDEVVVVDDKSIDNTVEEAKNAGAKVVISTKIGKGASMRDGLLVSKNEIIVFLDGDIENYAPDTIEKMVFPIIGGEADFVKATFEREAGRVTELVAKPLLNLLFPQLSHFSQPLSGMIAGRREHFEKITFDNGYGVDIGILIDMHLLGAKIVEVNIGAIKHKMKLWRELGRMSREVAEAILKKAVNNPNISLDSLGTINIIRDQMEFALKETLSTLKKMVIFDMDNTVLDGRFIDKVALTFGFQEQLLDIITKNQEPYLRTKLIAKLFKGLNISQLLSVTDDIPIVSDTIEVVKELKKRSYIVGIISDSYDCIAAHIKNKVGADFSLANELEFSQGIATGEVKIPSFFMKQDKSICNHSFCKSNALFQVAEQYGIELSNIIAVGDSESDICVVKYAGIGVAFCSSNSILNAIADQRIETRSFKQILDFAI
ncbi:MAG TPA: HAD-IB family phosphatase [candidate division Zixibacteria bacterium]